ncbi:hypothetical protein Bca52824_012140 [Brassica carinata]|uniref:Protein SCAR n=1 Tax=Brassica carinata TaxID=52824 RepID=A0A8X8B2Q7_BRACI|nr:hypothetical protein Bca52824_012140 [Brassica carinata]
MSFSRVGARNVYGMSQQAEFYANVDREDPEAILNGVAVSGLIGVLRQLGDLAESAAEIFQGIQEEVMATASRTNQLKIRLQHIEATVPPLEKAVLAQTTHLHFAYTGGVEWHPRIPHEQNHLIHDDLPCFIMDPYEECRDPPRLHMLDNIESESENDLKTSQQAVSSLCGVTDERLEKSVCEQELEQSSNSVEEFCRSMENGSVNATDEMSRQDPLESSNITGGEDNMACTLVPAPEISLSDSSNPLYHSDHQNSEAKVSREAEAIKIWTNGSLLGLNPSKPPVLEVPSSLGLDCKTEERTVGSAEAEKDKSDDLVEHVLLDTSSLVTQNLTVDQRECHETSYGVFGGLSQKLFTNSFRRRDSLSHDNRQALPAAIPENDVAATAEKSRFLFRDEAPVDWFSSSPPLQHMKISLNPVDTLQASRLKLKFSDEDNNNINSFPSFQLLPEAATSLLDSCSDDDDTFCRSSPCTSDIDYVSDYHSLSDSEQWEESSHSHERKDQELCVEPSRQETEAENGCVGLNFSYLQSPVEPLPPPFPPAQWMVSKTDSETSDNKTTQSLQLQDALRFAFERRTSSSIVNKEEPNIVASAPEPEIRVRAKNNVREDKQNANEKETDAEDFLQQIRTQHVNLRPVVMKTTLSSAVAATTDPAINMKISAMLEKANSIRQAVASNDGDESDTWSDT